MPRPLHVGVQLPEVERVVRWPELREMAIVAERAGFDSVWVGDHLLYRGDGRPERGPYDVWSVLAGLAAVTSRVEIGPLVACAGFRNPALLARTAQAVDEISGGRLVLGLGCGWNRSEFEAFGLPFDNRVARFEESFEAIRRLLSGERVTLKGSYVDLDDAVLRPAPLRRPPLMIGSNSPRMLSIALPYVERWNTWWDDYGNTADEFRALNAVISETAASAGRDPGDIFRSACALVVLDERSTERPVPTGVTPIPGEPHQLANALRRLAEAGADEAICVLSPITSDSVKQAAEALVLLDGD